MPKFSKEFYCETAKSCIISLVNHLILGVNDNIFSIPQKHESLYWRFLSSTNFSHYALRLFCFQNLWHEIFSLFYRNFRLLFSSLLFLTMFLWINSPGFFACTLLSVLFRNCCVLLSSFLQLDYHGFALILLPELVELRKTIF